MSVKRPARRRVLLVSHVFPPLVAGGAARMGQFARLLPGHGWDVTVLTGRHTASSLDRDTEARIASTARIIATPSPMGSVIKRGQPAPRHGVAGRVRRLARRLGAALLFPDREVLWAPGAIKAGAQALDEAPHDVVVATYGPPSNLVVAHALASRRRLPLILDFRDLWATLPMPVFPSPLHRWAAFQVEHRIIEHASRLIAVSPGMAADLAKTHGRRPEDAVSITNGFDPSHVTRVHDTRAGEPRPFRLVYTGTVHMHYDLDPLWQALRRMDERRAISPETFRLAFVGNLAMSDVREHDLERYVETSPFVAHDQVFDVLAHADALLVVETPGYYARYGYAAKVFDYLLTGKPVIGLVEEGGNTDSLLKEAGVGYCVAPDDSARLERVLLQVLSLKGASPRPVNPTARPFRDFNRDLLVAKLAAVLDDVVDLEPRGRWQ